MKCEAVIFFPARGAFPARPFGENRFCGYAETLSGTIASRAALRMLFLVRSWAASPLREGWTKCEVAISFPVRDALACAAFR